MTSHQTWLITGCSSGLGREIALAALSRGDRVVATARQTSDLDYLEGEKGALILQLDVCAPENVLREKTDSMIASIGPIDVLVNNAGFVAAGVWEELSDGEVRRQFDANFFGAMTLTRLVLGHMRPRRQGAIFFMGSIAGWHGAAASGPYAASKFALEGAAECLDREVKPFGIRVHLLIIGRFRTSILNGDKKKKTTHLDKNEGIQDYAVVKEELEASHAASDGKQPGDPKRAAERIVDLAKLHNLTQQQMASLPLRIPFGAEALNVMRGKAKVTVTSIAGWEDFARGMDYEDGAKLCDFML